MALDGQLVGLPLYGRGGCTGEHFLVHEAGLGRGGGGPCYEESCRVIRIDCAGRAPCWLAA